VQGSNVLLSDKQIVALCEFRHEIDSSIECVNVQESKNKPCHCFAALKSMKNREKKPIAYD